MLQTASKQMTISISSTTENHHTPHNAYIEPHLATGAIMKRKLPAMHSIGIDRDRRTVEGFTPGRSDARHFRNIPDPRNGYSSREQTTHPFS